MVGVRLASILVLSILALPGCGKPKPPSGRAEAWPRFTEEHGTNALGRVERLVAIRPRDSGTPGAAYAAQWIAQELRAVGLRPVADTWKEQTANGPMQFANIHADISGQTPALIVIGSHFDTKAGISGDFQGANDGGSSTGLALEMASILSQGPPLRHTVRFAFFDGEECVGSYRPNDGLHGSRRMAQKLAAELASQPVVAVIILDMVGDRNLGLEIPRNVTPWLARVALDAAVSVGYPQLTIARGAVIDDHWPFVEAGMSAVDLIDFEYGSAPGKNDYWHTEGDAVDKLSAGSLAVSGRIVLEMIRRLEEGTGVPAEGQGPSPEAPAR